MVPIAMSRDERQRIRVLDDHVVNQIAAGEVVERPASVVKELVENALDAGACQISVEYAEGGKSMVRVADDGEGMTLTEQRAALVRHATSKLVEACDLDELTTMGFRGEALPSIAAVSELTMVSRARGDSNPSAWQLVVRGGTIESESEVGAPVGTVITVRNLLFNMPARQKFMKGDGTESSHIVDTVTKLALANPSVRFRLVHNLRGKLGDKKRTSIDVPGNQSVAERVGALLGAKVGAELIPQTASGGSVDVELFLAPTRFVQRNAKAVQLFVGRRPVRDRGLLHAVMAGYGDLLGKGQFPTVVAYIEAGSGQVDYNVHPQKLEVRFADPQAVYAVVRGAIEQAISRVGWEKRESQLLGDASVAAQTVSAASPKPTRAAERLARYAASKRSSQWSEADASRTPSSAYSLAGKSSSKSTSRAPRWARNSVASLDSVPSLFRNRVPASGPDASGLDEQLSSQEQEPQASASGSGPNRQLENESTLAPHRASESTGRGYYGRLRYLGQLDLTFLVCEGDGELVLLDQHLAHEQVEFCRLRRLALASSIPMQRMLVPRVVELPVSSVMAVRHAEETAKAIGFELSAQSVTSVAISAAPTVLKAVHIDRVVTQLLDAVSKSEADGAIVGWADGENADHPVAQLVDNTIASIACHAAIDSGERLEDREAQALLANLDVETKASSRNGAETISRSHGTPLILRMQTDELVRKFFR